jgi:uncharacterized membrane protein YdjX (TVP38/TMEM64 family)
MHDSQHRRAWLKLGALLLLLTGGLVVALRLPILDGRQLSETLTEGPWAPVLFGAVYAAATLAPVPKNAMSVAAGFVFGFAVGAVVVWVAGMAGAWVAFWLGRVLGRDGVERLSRGQLARVDALVDTYGGWAVFGLRLVPVVPFTPLNYGSGLTALRLHIYLAATAVGVVPGTVAYVGLGAYGTDPWSLPFLAAAAVLLVLSVGAAALARRRRRRPPEHAAPPGVAPPEITTSSAPPEHH